MTVWAAIGVVWLVVVVAHAMIRWVTSDTEFAPAPVLGPDAIAAWNLLALPIFEGLCVVVIAVLVWFCVIRPWRQTDALGLDGKFVIAGFARPGGRHLPERLRLPVRLERREQHQPGILGRVHAAAQSGLTDAIRRGSAVGGRH